MTTQCMTWIPYAQLDAELASLTPRMVGPPRVSQAGRAWERG